MSIPTANSSLVDRFSDIIDILCRIVPRLIARDRSAGPLILLIHAHLRRMAVRFAAIAVRPQSGVLRAPRSGTARRRASSPRTTGVLPCGYAWLIRVFQETAYGGGLLQHLVLNDPEMAALLATSPQAGRIVRSLFWMLGIRPIPAIARRAVTVRAPRAVRTRAAPSAVPNTVPGGISKPRDVQPRSGWSSSYRPSARWPKAHWPRPPNDKPTPVRRKLRAVGPPWPD